MVSKTLIRATASRGGGEPSETIEAANHILCEDNDACLFVTTFYAVFDPGDGTFSYVNAGHPPPLLIHCDGTCEFIPPTGGLALGMAEDIPFSHASIVLRPDDCVVIYTDGVTEAFNEKGEEFTPERLPPVSRTIVPRTSTKPSSGSSGPSMRTPVGRRSPTISLASHCSITQPSGPRPACSRSPR